MIPKWKLNNGVEIPMFGFGVFLSAPGEETSQAVKWALEAGYRHIDTAMIYKNEEDVGKAIRESGVPREEIFLTTKLWNGDMREHRQLEAFEESLKRLGTDYVDMYMLHWPAGDVIESWRVLEQIYKSGRAKVIGVCNFSIRQLRLVLDNCEIVPAINQCECHPYFQQKELIAFCREQGIAFEAYAPLGGQKNNLTSREEIVALAEKYGKTPAQVILRWHHQRNVIVFPKSSHKERIVSNMQIFDFELSAEDMEVIARMESGVRFGSDPENFNF